MPLAMLGNPHCGLPPWQERPELQAPERCTLESLVLTGPEVVLVTDRIDSRRRSLLDCLEDIMSITGSSMASESVCFLGDARTSVLHSEPPHQIPAADPIEAAKSRWSKRALRRARFMEAVMATPSEYEDVPSVIG